MAAIRVDDAPTLIAVPEVAQQPDPPAVPDHELVIIESGSFARATCSTCGWSGPARRARAVAVSDGSAHS